MVIAAKRKHSERKLKSHVWKVTIFLLNTYCLFDKNLNNDFDRLTLPIPQYLDPNVK